MNFNILHFDSVGSTNTEAADQARLGADEGVCVVAREQTAGRGRHGRVWISELDAGLYFSIVLRPKIEMASFPLITLMAAVAVFEVLSSNGLDPDIKWPNDVLADEKKICGILAEVVETSRGRAVIVGIGINLTRKSYPADIADIATSLEDMLGRAPHLETILIALTRSIAEYYELLQSDGGAEHIRQSWAERSSYFEGKAVSVATETGTLRGITAGIEGTGALRIKREDGTIEAIHAGDVQRLR